MSCLTANNRGAVPASGGIAAILTISLCLSGCMGGGISGFMGADAISGASSHMQKQEAEARLAAAGLGAGPGAQRLAQPGPASPLDSQPAPAAVPPVAALAEPVAPGLAAESAPVPANEQLAELPLSPEAEALRARTQLRLASIPPAAYASGDDADADDPVLPYPEAADVVEIEAAARAEALYASMSHGRCEGGWGPKPKMLTAQRVTPGHPYYMEMRMRHTPMLPVGHVYIAYGRLDPEGRPLDEALIMLAPLGGYVGAGVASTVPMPGILTPHPADCVVEPEASYRVSLNAQRFEKLLLAIRQAHREKPTYHLFAYNCNHFMSEIASSVGILPPENIYQPSLVYFYDMVERNEGRKVPRTPAFVTASNYPPRAP